MKTVKILVSGRVQGVGFRWMTQILANELKVTGTVENLIDGQVEIVAQAPEAQLNEFIKQVKKSPSPAGRVDQMEITDLNDVKALHSFRVIG